MEITPEGLRFVSPFEGFLSFEKIQEVCPTGREPVFSQFPIHVCFQESFLTIPPVVDPPSGKLHAFLQHRCLASPPDRGNPPPGLAPFFHRQVERFGRNAVVLLKTRTQPTTLEQQGRIRQALAWGFLAAGMGWTVFGAFADDAGGWLFGGIFLILMGLAFAYSTMEKALPGRSDNCLCLGPLGMALLQGKHLGKLDWQELKDLRTGPPPFLTLGSSERGLHLYVAGATIRIDDVYDRPLEYVEEAIRSRWLLTGKPLSL